MIGKILDRRYVVLELAGPDGPGFRYVVYDMNALKRTHVRVGLDREGEVTEEAYEVVEPSTPLAGVPVTPPRLVSVPAPSLAVPLPVPAPVPASAPVPVATLPALGAFLPHLVTQPVDLTALEELTEELELGTEDLPRRRVMTREIEAAWFARGEELSQDGVELPPEWAETALADHAQLIRQAEKLSAEEYRRFALELSPPTPPARILEAFLSTRPEAVIQGVAVPVVEPAAPPVASEPQALPAAPAAPIAPAMPTAPVVLAMPAVPVMPVLAPMGDALAPRAEASATVAVAASWSGSTAGARPGSVARLRARTVNPRRFATGLAVGVALGVVVAVVLAKRAPDPAPVPTASSRRSESPAVASSSAPSKLAPTGEAADEKRASEEPATATRTGKALRSHAKTKAKLSVGQRRNVSKNLAGARQALRKKHWRLARTRALAVLRVQPHHRGAYAIKTRAESRLGL
ncbi:MAG: hypothetical protein IT371_11445 [Deltaproteobacteria bacterium]|nr:hypothetical protein [Deltaproteobacteria bacterium]